MKSNMSGMVKDYQRMYGAIKNWDEPSHPTKIIDGKPMNEEGHYIYGMGWGIGDAAYFGWTGDALQNERDHYENVRSKHAELKKALEEALGI